MADFMSKGGFLAPDFGELIAHNRVVNAAHFKVAEDVNTVASNLLNDVDEAGKERGKAAQTEQNHLAFLTFLRGVELFQAIVVMAERAMVNPMSILTRALLEAELKFCMAARSAADAEQLKINDLFQRKKQIEGVLAASSTATPQDKAACSAELSQLKGELQGKQEKWTVKQMADMLGQTGLYDVIYRFGSGAVHCNPGSLRQYIRPTERGLFAQVEIGPSFDEMPFFLGIAMCVQSELLRQASSYFQIDYRDQIAVLDGARGRLPAPKRFPNI